jgi:hypothetical protein
MNITYKGVKSITKSVYNINASLVNTLFDSMPSVKESLRMLMLSLILQLDFHTNPHLVKIYEQDEPVNLDLFFKSRDTVFEIISQSVYEFIQIFIANYMSNVVVNMSELINSDVLHTIFRFISVCVYLVYLKEHGIYSEVLRYTVYTFIKYIVNPIYKKLTGSEHGINEGYAYFTIVLIKIFYGMILVDKESINNLIKSICNIPKDFTGKNIMNEINKATEKSSVLSLTYGGVNMMKAVIEKIFSRISIVTVREKLKINTI